MPKFDASALVEGLDFDFTVYRPADPEDPTYGLEWAGRIPEPSDDAVAQLFQVALPAVGDTTSDIIDRYWTEQREARRAWWAEQHPGQDPSTLDNDTLDALDPGPDQIHAERDRYREITEEMRTANRAALHSAVAEFTQGHPPREVLEALPWRAFQMFLGWLTGQFRPEAVAAAMTS